MDCLDFENQMIDLSTIMSKKDETLIIVSMFHACTSSELSILIAISEEIKDRMNVEEQNSVNSILDETMEYLESSSTLNQDL